MLHRFRKVSVKKKPKWARRKIGLSPALCTKKILIRIRKRLGLNDCSLRGPPSEGSPQGAGGQPKTELHRPPPLPHDSRGCDHRHRARAVLTQTGSFKVNSSDFYFGVVFTSVDKKKITKVFVVVFKVTPKHDCISRLFRFDFTLQASSLSQTRGALTSCRASSNDLLSSTTSPIHRWFVRFDMINC